MVILDAPTGKKVWHWVVGLTWHAEPRSETKGALWHQTRDRLARNHRRARQEDPGLMVTAPGADSRNIVGLAGPINVDEKQCRSAALLAARAMGTRSSIGVYPLPDDQFWVVIIADGRVMEMGDEVLDAAFVEDFVAQAQVQFADRLKIHRADNVDETLAQIAEWSRQHSPARLQPLKPLYPPARRRQYAIAGLAAGILVAVGAAWWLWPSTPAVDPAETVAQREPPKPIYPPLPWAMAAPFEAAFQECISRYADLEPVVAGWELETWSCTNTEETQAWHRLSYGRYTVPPSSAAFDPVTPNVASSSVKIPVITDRGWRPLADYVSASQAIFDLARVSQVASKVEWGEPGRDPRYVANRVIFTSSVLPDAPFWGALQQIPSIVFDGLTYDDGDWTLETTLYTSPGEADKSQG